MHMQLLERRRMLSASAITATEDASGNVQVQGTSGNDQIFVTGGGGFSQVIDASTFTVVASFENVSSISIDGGAGDDQISYFGDTTGAFVNGGDGNDTIVVDDSGMSASTIMGGNGDDSILITQPGVGVTTVVDAGNGKDVITIDDGHTFDDSGNLVLGSVLVDGGNGNDTIFAFNTDATITGGNGTDSVTIVGGDSTATGAETVLYF